MPTANLTAALASATPERPVYIACAHGTVVRFATAEEIAAYHAQPGSAVI